MCCGFLCALFACTCTWSCSVHQLKPYRVGQHFSQGSTALCVSIVPQQNAIVQVGVESYISDFSPLFHARLQGGAVSARGACQCTECTGLQVPALSLCKFAVVLVAPNGANLCFLPARQPNSHLDNIRNTPPRQGVSGIGSECSGRVTCHHHPSQVCMLSGCMIVWRHVSLPVVHRLHTSACAGGLQRTAFRLGMLVSLRT